MDSDDSYETTSEVFRGMDVEQFSSSSQGSTNRGSEEIRELYASTFSAPQVDATNSENPVILMTEKIKEQSLLIHSLKEERIGFLEQITELCAALESKEKELVEFMQLYEQKANDVAQYMQEVQDLLAQLTDLFSDQLHETSTNGQHEKCCVGLPSQQARKLQEREDKMLHDRLPKEFPCTPWDQRGRALLHALSESVATATARNKQATLPRQTGSEQASASPEGVIKPIEIHTESNQSTYKSVQLSSMNHVEHPIDDDLSDSLAVTVCHLPPLCWSPDQVLYWLKEFACLPGGCIEVAKQMRLDGKQLTTLSTAKLDKILCLNDPGLQRKFQLAMEDLRVHGSPGVSHCPGPSHIRPHWVCEIWLRRYLGLAQLAPAFAVRRVDGRMLASLSIYKTSKHIRSNMFTTSCDSKSEDTKLDPHSVAPYSAKTLNGSIHGSMTSVKNDNGEWRGASRKELCRILLGVTRDSSSNNTNLSGAELPQTTRFLIGKREAHSLRTGIELLRRFSFNIELLEKVQKQCEDEDENLLVWTNERVAKWLQDLGLQAFTHGIDGTGLHGAYMVLDPHFDTSRLMKYIHLPVSVATSSQLDSRLQALLKPARLREGNLTAKQYSFFRRRSLSRSGRAYLLQRAAASSTVPGHGAATKHSIRIERELEESKAQLIHPSPPLSIANGTAPSVPIAGTAKETKFSLTPLPLRRMATMLESGKSESGCLKSTSTGQGPVEKRKAVLVCKEQNSNRLARVFSRGPIRGEAHSDKTEDSSFQDGVTSYAADIKLETSEESSGTLVRKAFVSANSADEVSKSSLSKRLVIKKSPSPTELEPRQPTHVREGVKPSEAPLIDPLGPDGWRGRIRIKLNQSTRSFQPNPSMGSETSAPQLSGQPKQNNSADVPLPPSSSAEKSQYTTDSDTNHPSHYATDPISHRNCRTECDSPNSLTLSSASLLSHGYTSSQNSQPK